MFYEVLVFLHIVAAIIWIGSGFLLQVLAHLADSRREEATFGALMRYTAELGPKVFMPASMAVLVLGVVAAIDGPWSFDQLWIVLGLVGAAATFVTGVGFLKPQGEKLAAITERNGGVLGPDGMHEARRLITLARLDYAVLLVVVFDMVVKPTGDDVGALLVMAAVVLAGAAWVVSRLKRLEAGPAPATA